MNSRMTRKQFLTLAVSGAGFLAAGPVMMQLEKAAQASKKVAVVDPNKCLPWDGASECSDCAGACGSETPALQWKPITVVTDGKQVTLQRPVIQSDVCAGCGACAAACGGAAISLCES